MISFNEPPRSRVLPALTFLVAVAAGLLSAACVRPGQHSPEGERDAQGRQESASFTVAEIEGTLEPQKPLAGWGLPTETKASFRACMHDRRSNDPIKGHKFSLQIFDGSTIEPSTDWQGCLRWQEDIPFNPLADAKGIVLEREIQAKGMYLGFRKVRVAIFPWTCATCARSQRVVDLGPGYGFRRPREGGGFTYTAVPNDQLASESGAQAALQGLDTFGQRALRPLFLSDLVAVGTPDVGVGNGGQMDFLVTFTPRVQVKDLLRATSSLQVPDGSFHVNILVVWVTRSSDGSEHRVIIGRAHTTEPKSHLGGGQVSISVPTDRDFPIQARPITGHAELAVRVSPAGGPPSLDAYEGLLRPSTGLNFTTRIPFAPVQTNAALRVEQRFSFAAYGRFIDNWNVLRAANGGVAPEIPGLQTLAPFRVQNVTVIPRAQVGNLVSRQANYDVRVCLNIGGEDRPAISTAFPVTGADGRAARCMLTQSGACLSDVNGCVTFSDQFTFQPYKPEAFVRRKAVIQFNRDHHEDVEYQINPWTNAADWKNAGISPERWNQVNPNQTPSQFVLDRMTFKNNGTYHYFVDRFLESTLERPIVVELNLRVAQNNAFILTTQRSVAQPVAPGWYGVRFGLEKEYYRHPPENTNELAPGTGTPTRDFIAVAQTLYEYKSGPFNPTFTLDIPDVGMMRLRANALVEVQLLDESKLTSEMKQGRPVSTRVFDELAVRDAGLNPRTFVGSTIFLQESDSSTMIPTDEIRVASCSSVECERRDVDSQGAGTRMIVGDLSRLRGKTFTDLIGEMNEGHRLANGIREDNARLSTALTAVNLDFVPLTEQAERRFFAEDALLRNHNRILSRIGAIGDLLAKLNDPTGMSSSRASRTTPVTPSDMQRFVETGEAPPSFYIKFCEAMMKASVDYLWPRPSAAHAHLNVGAPWVRNCYDVARSADPQSFWEVERKLRVHAVDPYPDESQQVFLLNFTAGADFGVGHQVSTDDSYSYGAGVGGGVGGSLLEMLKSTMTSMFMEALSLKADVKIDYSHSHSWGESHGERLNFGSRTYLGVDIHPMRIELRRYERCLSIRPRMNFIRQVFIPSMPSRDRATWAQAPTSGPLIPSERLHPHFREIATRGFLLCDGEIKTEPIRVPERYYYVSQQMSDGVYNDTRSAQANPWLKGLRGRGDFLQFVAEIRGHSYCSGRASEHVSHGEGPIEQLAAPFRHEARVATLPGMYTIEPTAPRTVPDLPECTETLNTWFRVWRPRGG